MFKKSALPFAIVALMSNAASAFQSEVDLSYATNDNIDTISAGYRYHFTSVDITNTAWAEAPFMTRSDNVGVFGAYHDFDAGDDTAFGLNGRVHFDDWYVAGEFATNDADDTLTVEGGYYYGETTAAYLRVLDTDSATNITLGTKNIYALANSTFLAIDANVTDADGDAILFGARGDYYFNPQTSLGLGVEVSDDSDVDAGFGLYFGHYFNPGMGVQVSYVDNGDIETITAGLNIRF